MSESSDLTERWRSFFQSESSNAVHEFARKYPDSRSIEIDIISLYEFDEDLLQLLFETPTRVLAVGGHAVRQLANITGPVVLRPENHPHHIPASSVRARHINELITIEGLVQETGPIRARARTGKFECGVCGEHTESCSMIGPPSRPSECEQCGEMNRLHFQHDQSSYLDTQRLQLTTEDRAEEAKRNLSARVDDELINHVDNGDKGLFTGILSVETSTYSVEYSPVLQVLSISQEQTVTTHTDLREFLDEQWN